MYKTALNHLINDWLDGHIGDGQPTEQWERNYIERVNREVNGENKQDIGSSKDTNENKRKLETSDVKQPAADVEIREVYKRLVAINVPGHLRTVTSHRRWIRLTYDFLQLVGAHFSYQMHTLIRKHDLSKYTHREVLGYAIMFGDDHLGLRKPNTEQERFEWNNTLYNHYMRNPHHPEYFYTLQAGETPDKDVSMLILDTINGKGFLDEGLNDMLAARGERDLAADKKFNVKKWLHLDEDYFRRFKLEDKRYVLERLDNFYDLAQQFFAKKENMKLVTDFFDDRQVVFE